RSPDPSKAQLSLVCPLTKSRFSFEIRKLISPCSKTRSGAPASPHSFRRAAGDRIRQAGRSSPYSCVQPKHCRRRGLVSTCRSVKCLSPTRKVNRQSEIPPGFRSRASCFLSYEMHHGPPSRDHLSTERRKANCEHRGIGSVSSLTRL